MLTMCVALTLFRKSKTKTSPCRHVINKCQIILVSIFCSINVPLLSSHSFSYGTILSLLSKAKGKVHKSRGKWI